MTLKGEKMTFEERSPFDAEFHEKTKVVLHQNSFFDKTESYDLNTTEKCT